MTIEAHDQYKISAILTDIEGTTTPIDFVKETLFGFVRSRIKQFLMDHWEEKECMQHVDALYNQVSISIN